MERSEFNSSPEIDAIWEIAIQGDALWQFETFAGLVFRF